MWSVLGRVCFGTAAVLLPVSVAAQPEERPFRLGLVVAGVASAEFDTTELGAGVQFTWSATSLVGAEVEVVVHPRDMGRDVAFSSGRTDTLFGVTVGPRMGRFRPFAKVRLGILRFWQAPEPVACIAIFPPPVRCTLANGRTVVAVDVGGGVDLLLTGRTFLRLDAGDRLMSFPGPVRDSAGLTHEGGFFAHDFRLAIAGGLRF
jgi:hypothetical protein